LIKLFVLGLRGASIGARFLLSFLFVKYISLEFQGEYSLLLTSITVLMLVTGFDFYVFSNRFMIKNREQTGYALTNQFFFHLITYTALFILFIVLTLIGITNEFLTITILFLLIFEHLGMEFFRVFVAIEKVLIANVILFVRTGTWPLLLIYQLIYTTKEITLTTIITYWMTASIISVVLCIPFIYDEIRGTKFYIDKKWIKRGTKVAALFFIATFSQKIIEFSDRYIIDSFLGAKSLGIYSFYFQLANVVNVTIFTVLISFMYPKIIYFIDKKRKKEAIVEVKKLKKYIIVLISLYAMLLSIILPYILDFVGKPELYDFQIVFYIFLTGNLFFNLSFASHYALLAIEKDKELMKISIGLAVFSLVANLIGVAYFGIIGAVIVFAISSLLLYIIKYRTENQFFKNYDW
jgi:O-antigen/teichoic acid export membrane protein